MSKYPQSTSQNFLHTDAIIVHNVRSFIQYNSTYSWVRNHSTQIHYYNKTMSYVQLFILLCIFIQFFSLSLHLAINSLASHFAIDSLDLSAILFSDKNLAEMASSPGGPNAEPGGNLTPDPKAGPGENPVPDPKNDPVKTPDVKGSDNDPEKESDSSGSDSSSEWGNCPCCDGNQTLDGPCRCTCRADKVESFLSWDYARCCGGCGPRYNVNCTECGCKYCWNCYIRKTMAGENGN